MSYELSFMRHLSQQYGYTHTFAIKFYVRDDVNYINVNPVCKDEYHFALHASKLNISNDNHASPIT